MLTSGTTGTSGAAREARLATPPAQRRYADPEGAGLEEVPLTGGRLARHLVRVGDTVRREAQPQSLAVAGYLDHLERVGFDGAPRFLGRDAAGRDVVTYLPGDVAVDPRPAWSAGDDLLASVARLLRRLHEASAGYAAERGFAAGEPGEGLVWRKDLVRVDLPDPEPEPELISHTDVLPANVVVRDGEAVALIDFELAGPTTRMLNLYTTAVHWVPLCPPERLPDAWRHVDIPARLRIFTDAYGLGAAARRELPDFGIARADITWRRMRASAEQLGGGWADLWAQGAGDDILQRKAWLTGMRDVLLAHL